MPVYPASEEIPPKKLRELVATRSPSSRRYLPDPLPADLELPLPRDALQRCTGRDDGRRPRGRAAARARRAARAAARRRALARRRTTSRPRSSVPATLVGRYRGVLPFALTAHQERAIAEIDLDLARTVPMQRLLQGDVGSGKTVVALYALLRAVETAARAR